VSCNCRRMERSRSWCKTRNTHARTHTHTHARTHTHPWRCCQTPRTILLAREPATQDVCAPAVAVAAVGRGSFIGAVLCRADTTRTSWRPRQARLSSSLSASASHSFVPGSWFRVHVCPCSLLLAPRCSLPARRAGAPPTHLLPPTRPSDHDWPHAPRHVAGLFYLTDVACCRR